MSADSLADVLTSVRLTGSVFFRVECAPPWVAEAPPSRAIAARGLPPDRSGWLAGLCDPYVGRALAALHASPGDAWTVEQLARAAGLARSSLAERFAALIGEPPMQYLTRWRMQVAAGLLATTHDGVAAVAARVGYASEAAFNRAFKKSVGVLPATWRRRRAAQRGSARAGPPGGGAG